MWAAVAGVLFADELAVVADDNRGWAGLDHGVTSIIRRLRALSEQSRRRCALVRLPTRPCISVARSLPPPTPTETPEFYERLSGRAARSPCATFAVAMPAPAPFGAAYAASRDACSEAGLRHRQRSAEAARLPGPLLDIGPGQIGPRRRSATGCGKSGYRRR